MSNLPDAARAVSHRRDAHDARRHDARLRVRGLQADVALHVGPAIDARANGRPAARRDADRRALEQEILPSKETGSAHVSFREDVVWLAGLMEGEGCFTMGWNRKSGKMQPRIQLQMTDLDVVQRASRAPGPCAPCTEARDERRRQVRRRA